MFTPLSLAEQHELAPPQLEKYAAALRARADENVCVARAEVCAVDVFRATGRLQKRGRNFEPFKETLLYNYREVLKTGP